MIVWWKLRSLAAGYFPMAGEVCMVVASRFGQDAGLRGALMLGGAGCQSADLDALRREVLGLVGE